MKLTFEVEAKDEQSWREWRDKVSMNAHATSGAIVEDWYYGENDEED